MNRDKQLRQRKKRKKERREKIVIFTEISSQFTFDTSSSVLLKFFIEHEIDWEPNETQQERRLERESERALDI